MVLARFKQINYTYNFILSKTTGFIQVYNVTINRLLKDYISKLAKIYYNNYKEQ